MLDSFRIFTRGGLVVFSKHLSSSSSSSSSAEASSAEPYLGLIRNHLLEERSTPTYHHSDGSSSAVQSTVQWITHNELKLIFACAHQPSIAVPYASHLLEQVKVAFEDIYEPNTQRQPCTYHAEFDATFEKILKASENKADKTNQKRRTPANSGPAAPSKASAGSDGAAADSGTPVDEDDESEEEQDTTGAFDVSKLTQKRKGGAAAVKDAKNNSTAATKKGKQARNWSRVRGDKDDLDDDALDFSSPPTESAGGRPAVSESLVASAMDDDDDKEAEVSSKKSSTAQRGWLSQAIRFASGGTELDDQDIAPILETLKGRLMAKNVAEEIASKLCESVRTSLVGKKRAALSSINGIVEGALEDALVRILTPKKQTDVLREAMRAKSDGRVYSIVFIGVNGVGKSTNLAKVAHWLMGHGLKVMLCACDTFRSGAVEQLRTHATRLGIPLFERGYEKDPSSVAREGLKHAAATGIDVVLVDTAGRMQDNEPLMRALAKLVHSNDPDLVLFVGEMLVGNDAVDQLTKFHQKLIDLCPVAKASKPRSVDAICLTKYDTVDDKVGAALSMVYVSGAPIVFVGTGQSYQDLRKLSVKNFVDQLMR
ncbi:signal recognition particle receptor subunit alpha [Pycnococcus provasolii]